MMLKYYLCLKIKIFIYTFVQERKIVISSKTFSTKLSVFDPILKMLTKAQFLNWLKLII